MGMVVRTNTMAINANRQLGVNNNQVAKSLEKLSSGFRINRAGDDASGLAISEKMKAQIKGLEQASANAQDGISLIQTAEGNLAEVHDMLNRMVELAEKSANGILEAEDRASIQEEMNALAAEIDRIADSANFNNLKLFDGTMSGGAAAGDVVIEAKVDSAADNLKFGSNVTFAFADDATEEQKAALSEALGESGASIVVKATGSSSSGGNVTLSATGQPTGYTWEAPAAAAWNSVKGAESTLTLKDAEGKTVGTLKATIAGTGVTTPTNTTPQSSTVKLTVGEAKEEEAPTTATMSYALTGKLSTTNKKISIDGTEYEYASTATTGKISGSTLDDQMESLVGLYNGDDKDFEASWDTAGQKLVFTAKEGKEVTKDTAPKVTCAAGITVGEGEFKEPEGGGSGKGLKLQIGDSNYDYDKLLVSMDDMHMKALFDKTALTDAAYTKMPPNNTKNELGTGTAVLGKVDGKDFTDSKGNPSTSPINTEVADNALNISTQDNAGAALKAIRNVIGKVSTQRGKLGAIQNRLEHTINNLDTAYENMTAANSRIRDTDMAKEMMNYTKMNVLVQSAQAMLAQANQQPQSILQLLQ